ncbi:hypothetical protein ACIQVA_39955 [Streptomyces microflavus]|uniref:hypothetical protein n=1 Tax=Streptomyces microflavus TaxID=1919 RepID=UPI0038105442
MNNMKRVIVAVALAGAALAISGTAHADGPTVAIRQTQQVIIYNIAANIWADATEYAWDAEG